MGSVEEETKPLENGSTKGEDNADKKVLKEETKVDPKEEWLDILGSGQIRKKVLREGEKDTRPQRSDICVVNIEGKLIDGTCIEKYEKLSVHAGDGEVIQGIDLVLSLMDIGELALVEIGPRFGFGPQGRPAENNFPPVPGDAQLLYTVELLNARPEPELESISLLERKTIGNRKRERGNWWYGRGENTLAIQCYRRALDFLDEAVGGIQIEPDNALKSSNEDEEALSLVHLLEDRLKVYNNLAAAQLKIGALDAGLMSVENVLRCQPNNIKALFRKSKILAEKGEHQLAAEILERVTELEPSNSAAHAELKVQRVRAKESTQQQKNLYRKMLGGAASGATRQRKLESSPRSKFAWGMVFGSVAAVVVGMVAYRFKLALVSYLEEKMNMNMMNMDQADVHWLEMQA